MVHNILGSVDILGVLRFIYEDWRRGRGRRVEGVRKGAGGAVKVGEWGCGCGWVGMGGGGGGGGV